MRKLGRGLNRRLVQLYAGPDIQSVARCIALSGTQAPLPDQVRKIACDGRWRSAGDRGVVACTRAFGEAFGGLQ